jgi:hypothetical protein
MYSHEHLKHKQKMDNSYLPEFVLKNKIRVQINYSRAFKGACVILTSCCDAKIRKAKYSFNTQYVVLK